MKTLDHSRKIYVYRNLRRNCLSLQQDGIIVGYAVPCGHCRALAAGLSAAKHPLRFATSEAVIMTDVETLEPVTAGKSVLVTTKGIWMEN